VSAIDAGTFDFSPEKGTSGVEVLESLVEWYNKYLK